MNAHAVNLKIKNREALNHILKTLVDLELDSEAGSASVHALMGKIASLRELSPSEAKTTKGEEVELELSALVDAASNYSEELDQYRNDIVVLGQDSVKLYTVTDVKIERDPNGQNTRSVRSIQSIVHTSASCKFRRSG